MDANKAIDTTTARLGVMGSLMALLILVLAGGGYFLINRIDTGQQAVSNDVHEIQEQMIHVVDVVEQGNEDSESRFDRMVTLLQRLVDAQIASCWSQANGDATAQSICASIGRPAGAVGLQGR